MAKTIFNHHKKKRGATVVSNIVSLTLVAVSFFFILVFVLGVGDVSKAVAKETKCRTSISSGAVARDDGLSLFPVNCPRRFIRFYREGYKVYYADSEPLPLSEIKFHKTFDRDDDIKTEFYEMLASEWATCWYKTGEGKMPVFNDPGWFTGYTCMICAEIVIDKESILKDDSISLGTKQDFYGFIKEAKFEKYEINQEYERFLLNSIYDNNNDDYDNDDISKIDIYNTLVAAKELEDGEVRKDANPTFNFKDSRVYYVSLHAKKADDDNSDNIYLPFIFLPNTVAPSCEMTVN